MNNFFKQSFKQTLIDAKLELKNIINQTDPLKDILILGRFIIIIANPYEEFNHTAYDFNRFYENIENASNNEIKE